MCVHAMLTLGVCFSLENYAIIWYFSFIITLKKIFHVAFSVGGIVELKLKDGYV